MATEAATLNDLGWDQGWAAAFLPFDAEGRRPARVVAAHRDSWVLATPDGDRDAVISGRLRHEALGPGDLPAVGDWVATTTTDGDGAVVVQAVIPRRTAFRRSNADSSRRSGLRLADEQVLAANVDTAFVVAGLDHDFNLRRMERYLAVAWSGGANPVLVLNKSDVATDLLGLRLAAASVAPGVEVRVTSAITGEGVAELAAEHLGPGRTAVVLGSSGVGKSTLVNALLGHEHLRTAAVRAVDSRGRHTTTHRELVRLPGGGLLIDTPGIRSLGVAGAANGIESTFADIEDLATGCRFRDCRHEREPGCGVLVALGAGTLAPERLDSHRKLEREAAHHARAGDPRAQAEERRRWRRIQASVQVHMKSKYGSDR
jgi:ribosome biogenesis GTPase